MCTNRSRARELTPVMSEVQELRGIFLRGSLQKCLPVCVCLFVCVCMVCLCKLCWLTPDVRGSGCRQKKLERAPLYSIRPLLVENARATSSHMAAGSNISAAHSPRSPHGLKHQVSLSPGKFNKFVQRSVGLTQVSPNTTRGRERAVKHLQVCLSSGPTVMSHYCVLIVFFLWESIQVFQLIKTEKHCVCFFCINVLNYILKEDCLP